MKLSLGRLLAVFAVVCLALLAMPVAVAQYTTVSASHVGGTANPAANATIYFQPVSAASVGSGGGQILGVPFSATVLAGAVSISLPDALLASPNTCYAVTVIDNVTGNVLLGAGLAADGVRVTLGGVYGCIQPTGSTWSFDTFIPPIAGMSEASGSTGIDTTARAAAAAALAAANGALQANGVTTTSGGNLQATTVVAKNIGLSVIADQYTSASDCTAKILAAKSAMAANGVTGTISVGNACGTTTSAGIVMGSNALDLSSGAYTMEVAQPGVYLVSQPITLGQDGGALQGAIPMASNAAAITLKEADGANLPYLISMASGSTLANLKIDCNKASNPTAQDCVLVSDANRVHIHNVTIQNAKRDNLHVTNTMYPAVQPSYSYVGGEILTCNNGAMYRVQVVSGGVSDSTYPVCSQTTDTTVTWGTSVTLKTLGTVFDGLSGSGYLGPNVLIQNGGRDGMFTERNGDWVIDAQVEFELNGRDGFHCEDCATYRFSNDDFGTNQRYGFYAAVVNAHCTSGIATMGHIIKGSQFGGNAKSGTGGDIYNSGSALSGTGFCGTAGGYQYAGGNNIVGNSFIGLGTTSTSVDSVTFVDAGGNALIGNVWGQLPWAGRFNYLVNSSFSTLSGTARQGQYISGNTTIKTFSGPIYQANQGSTPFSLTSGVDVASAITSAATVTDWMNRVITGTLTVGGTVTLPNGSVCQAGDHTRVGLSATSGDGTSAYNLVCLSASNDAFYYGVSSMYFQPSRTDVGGYNGAIRQVAIFPGNFNLPANMSFRMQSASDGVYRDVLPANTLGAKGATGGGQSAQMTDSTAAAGYLPMWNSDLSLGKSGVSADAAGNTTSPAGTTHAILDKNGHKAGWTVQGSDGNLIFFSTDAAGNQVPIFSIYSGQDNQATYFHKAVMADGSTATTQSSGDTSSKIATDAFVSTAIGTKAGISSTTPTVGAGVCWKTATTVGSCFSGTWPNCSDCR